MRRTQVGAQSRRFFDVWAVYNGEQVDFHERSKKLFVKRCKITGVQLSEEEIEERIHERDTAVFARGILDQERVARQQLSELQNRHEDFLKLERSITEVRDMFAEVAALVQEQGEMIDRIEVVAEEARTDVERGKDHLKKAEQHAIAARKKKICLAAVLAVVLLIVVVVVLSEFGFFSGGGGGGVEERIVYVEATTPKPPRESPSPPPTVAP